MDGNGGFSGQVNVEGWFRAVRWQGISQGPGCEGHVQVKASASTEIPRHDDPFLSLQCVPAKAQVDPPTGTRKPLRSPCDAQRQEA